MKIAMFTGGQPRFTEDFLTLLKQLSGFESADLYIALWKSDWVTNEEEGVRKINKILPTPYKLAKLSIIDEPHCELPPHTLNHPPEEYTNIRWWYRRRRGQLLSLSYAFDLIDKPYDAYVRFRLDGCLDKNLDISTLDLTNNEFIMPGWPLCGYPGRKLCDQFSVGTYEGMKFFCNLGKQVNKFITISDPQWEHNEHGNWSPEHLIATYYDYYNKKIALGNFGAVLNSRGRSRYTDKHYHHPIVSDPTDL